MTIAERLLEFYRRLGAALPARTANEALELIGRVLEQVEDELSGIPKEANPGKDTKGRMYPPLPERINTSRRRFPDRAAEKARFGVRA